GGIRLLVVAHGTRDSAGQRVIGRLVEAVRGRLPGVAVELAWVDVIGPEPGELLADGVPTVLVPVFLGYGYHVGHDLPAVVRSAPGPVEVTEHLGAADEVVDALVDRLTETATVDGAGSRRGHQSRALVLAGAGSSSERAVGEARAVAKALSRRTGHRVFPGFAVTAEPSVAEAIAAAASVADEVTVVTYLLAPGFFADRVRKQAAAVAGTETVIRVTDPIGTHDAIIGLI